MTIPSRGLKRSDCDLKQLISPQWAIHGQTTFKQRYFNVFNVYTTLFQRRLTMMCPLRRQFGETKFGYLQY